MLLLLFWIKIGDKYVEFVFDCLFDIGYGVFWMFIELRCSDWYGVFYLFFFVLIEFGFFWKNMR